MSIDHVSCGSAHSIAWSSMQRKLVCPLPSKVPVEFNHLQPLSLVTLRNRLILLHHFSNLFCKSLTMFMLQLDHSRETDLGYNNLRGIIMSSAKVKYTYRPYIKYMYSVHMYSVLHIQYILSSFTGVWVQESCQSNHDSRQTEWTSD